MLETYFTDEAILAMICKARAKLAKQRGKKHLIHLLADDIKTNYHINHKKNAELISNDLKILNSILPPRRKWKTLKKARRYLNNYQRIDSIRYNELSLLETINYFRKNKPDEPFVIRLANFIQDIKDTIYDENFTFEQPSIIPRTKKRGESKCRPIALYNLKDRIIISLTNRYLSNFFDAYFYSDSHAFRPKRLYKGEEIITSHHNAIDSILEYREKYAGKKLYVSECDISKFYDSVSHKTVKQCFNKLLLKSGKKIDENAKRLFFKYLASYSFVHNVKVLNDPAKKDYWKQSKVVNGHFGWVEDELKTKGYYRNINHNRIGVPQGGAISGFIANLVLHYADVELIKYPDKRLHYVRFCDDMMIIHPFKKECLKYYNIYHKCLCDLKLIPHKPVLFNFNDRTSFKKFWSDKIKSKSPYKWSDSSKNSTKWIGFVGYEISYNKDIRVRKSSLIKEKTKQRRLVEITLNSVKNGQRKSKDSIIESVCNRLIGMSVGRVTIKNFESMENECCWIKGFDRLTKNKYLSTQLKNLDYYRNKQIYRLKKNLKNIENKKGTHIPKYIFTYIPRISMSDSENIRNELVRLNILTAKYKLNQIQYQDIILPHYILSLSERYEVYAKAVLMLLIQFRKKDRNINFYGRPFSYYYHVTKKDNLIRRIDPISNHGVCPTSQIIPEK